MNQKEKKVKAPITQESIFKVMMIMTFGISALFFVKNLLNKDYRSALVIGGCLAVFTVLTILMKQMKIQQYHQQFVLCIALVILVFLISANSGTFYSDDFPLYLALVGLSGMYLEPKYTVVQTVLITFIFGILYAWHPEKADPLGQYIMCVVIFNVAAFTIYMTIKRGRAFIEVSMVRAEEADKMLQSIKKVEVELKKNYEQSNQRMQGMASANRSLETNINSLSAGSAEIHQCSFEVQTACDDVQIRIQETEHSIDALNSEVKQVENALSESKRTMVEMDEQMHAINQIVRETNQVFTLLQDQIHQISGMTDQLSTIASTTKILALNASVEAARAGRYGAGFAVVASEVQQLATNSTDCSNQVIHVVEDMNKQIDITSHRLADSVTAISTSIRTLTELEQEFDGLITRFDSLYRNIENQNENVSNVDAIFDNLKAKIMQMNINSNENRQVVDSIVDAITTYKTSMNQVVDDAKIVHDLSASMLDISQR